MTKTILRNFVSNAIKFTNPDGIVIIKAIEQKSEVEVHVSDNGVGIEKDKIPDLFLIEKNTSTKGTANESGTG
jgi:two-component system, sensor histidine kinase and response regulator